MVKLFDLLEKVFGPITDSGLELGAPCQIIIHESPLITSDLKYNRISDEAYAAMEKLDYDIEGYDLYAVRNQHDYYFALKNDQGDFITALHCIKYFKFPIELNPDNKNVLQIKFSWTNPKYRGNEYNAALIDGLGQLFAIVLSDYSTGKSAYRSWEKIIKRKPYAVINYDLLTKQKTDESPNDNGKVVFALLEFCNNRQPNSWMKQHKIFTEGLDESEE
jgi:hypothetical protein